MPVTGAGELIAEGTLAIEMGATAEDLKLTIHPHPTLSETLMESAEVFFGQSTHVFKPIGAPAGCAPRRLIATAPAFKWNSRRVTVPGLSALRCGVDVLAHDSWVARRDS